MSCFRPTPCGCLADFHRYPGLNINRVPHNRRFCRFRVCFSRLESRAIRGVVGKACFQDCLEYPRLWTSAVEIEPELLMRFRSIWWPCSERVTWSRPVASCATPDAAGTVCVHAPSHWMSFTSTFHLRLYILLGCIEPESKSSRNLEEDAQRLFRRRSRDRELFGRVKGVWNGGDRGAWEGI